MEKTIQNQKELEEKLHKQAEEIIAM